MSKTFYNNWLKKDFIQKGFSLGELMMVLAIFLILFTIGTYTFISSRQSNELNTITDNVDSYLEQAKSDAMSGKNGSGYGIKFATTSYTYFVGTTYDSAASTNIVYPINTTYEISTNLSSSDRSVAFTRLTGVPTSTGTTTIRFVSNPSRATNIVITSEGDITVLK